MYIICPCPVLDRLYDVTAGGYLISPSLYTHKLNESPLPFPDEPELPWVQLYRQCRFIPDFVNLYKDNRSYSISNHDPFNTSRGRGYHGRGHRGRDPVNAGRGPVNTSCGRGYHGRGHRGSGPVNTSCGPANMKYEYTRDEFLLAMGALSDYVKKTEDTLLRESQIVITELENDANPQSERERCIAELSPQQKTDIKDNLSKLLQTKELRLLNRKVILEHPQILAHLRKHVTRPTVFVIKVLTNDDVPEDGYMKYFDEDQLSQNITETPPSSVTDSKHRDETHSAAVSTNEEIVGEPHQQKVAKRITFYEMKVILDYGYAKEKHIEVDELFKCYQNEQATRIDKSRFKDTKDKATTSWKLVNYCRFVFAKFNNPTVKDEITGILFFTDNHYGHTLIEFDEQHVRKMCKDCLDKFEGKVYLRNLCYPCQYAMQEITISQARLQYMLCEQCWDKLDKSHMADLKDCCRETLRNKDLKREDKLCVACCKKCKSIVKSKRWPKIKDACTECQDKMLAQAKKVQFPFKKIGRLTLKYNDDNKLNEILLSECT